MEVGRLEFVGEVEKFDLIAVGVEKRVCIPERVCL